jgi:membrane protease YdiL (CAAX protease family)
MIVSNIKNRIAGPVVVVLTAVVVVWAWVNVLMVASGWMSNGYHLMSQHLAGAVFLLVVLLPYHRFVAPIGFGRIWQRASVLPAVAVLALYSVEFGYEQLTAQPPEIWVQQLLMLPPLQLASAFFTILILAPVSEEIIFRGIILNVFRTSRTWTLWAGVVIIALVFAAIHTQYRHLSTLMELMVLSAIFAWARFRSGGLALPVMLHAFASALAVIFTLLS